MGRKRASLWRGVLCRTPPEIWHLTTATTDTLLLGLTATETDSDRLIWFCYFSSILLNLSISNNLEAWIVIQYKSPCPDGALEKTIIAAANHLSFGLGSQTSTIQIKWSSKFKFANHYSFSVPPSIRLTVDENWRERCLEHKQRKPVNCPN